MLVPITDLTPVEINFLIAQLMFGSERVVMNSGSPVYYTKIGEYEVDQKKFKPRFMPKEVPNYFSDIDVINSLINKFNIKIMNKDGKVFAGIDKKYISGKTINEAVCFLLIRMNYEDKLHQFHIDTVIIYGTKDKSRTIH